MEMIAFIVVFIVVVMPSASMADGKCEKIENWISLSVVPVKTCYMESTVIDSNDFMITSDRDESVGRFYAYENKKLEYLPSNLGAKFSNLIRLRAGHCSIKEIAKENFKDLHILRQLFLQYNQIEKIDADTFEYIPTVEQIDLLQNKIKILNGRAFASLHKLTWVDLADNACINERFETAARIAEMSRAVSEKCGFVDNQASFSASSTEFAKLHADLKAKSKELQAIKLDNIKLQTAKTHAELQLAHQNEIDTQNQQTWDSRMELKVREILQCSNELQAKTAEINEKNKKIEQLQKKVRILSGNLPL